MSDAALPTIYHAELAPRPLTATEAEELLQRITELARAGGNLPAGLRAAAASSTQANLSHAFNFVADRLEQGLPLDAALTTQTKWLPTYLVSLVAAALRSGDCNRVLSEVVELRSKLTESRRDMRAALAYPLLVLAFASLIFIFICNTALPNLLVLFLDHSTAEPIHHLPRFWHEAGPEGLKFLDGVYWIYTVGQWNLYAWITVFTIALLIARKMLPWAVWCRLCSAIPIVGPIWHWSALAEFTKLVSLLLDQQLPLDKACRLAGEASSNGDMQTAAEQLAAQLERGVPLDAALSKAPQMFPAIMQVFLQTGVSANKLPETFNTLSKLLIERVVARTALIRSIGPPLVFMLIAIGTLSVAGAFGTALNALVVYLGGLSPPAGQKIAIGVMFFQPRILIFLPPTIAMLIAMRIIFRGSRGVGRHYLEAFLVMLAWRLLVVCLLLAIACGSSTMFIPILLITIFVMIRCLAGYNLLYKRLFLWNLTTAGEANVPLLPVLLASAEEAPSGSQWAATKAAKLVEQGTALSTALYRSWYWLPYELRFALISSEATGNFGSTLRQALSLDSRARQQQTSVSEKMTYLAWVFFFIVMILTFIMLKIVPVYAKMFDEFGLELPAMTALAVECCYFFLRYGFLIMPVILMSCGALITLFDPAVARWLAFFFPPLEWLWMKRHGATILRGMAVMVQHGRPLQAALRVAAEQYPVYFVQWTLRTAFERIVEGQAWHTVLWRLWFISRSDAAILASAERAGNLAWALEEVAEGIDRRTNIRTRLLANLIFPALIIVISFVIGFIAIAMLMPLISLIQGFAGYAQRPR